ncbi:MAG: hypothetical protein WAK16_02740 [Candidatus Cybelea sp.]
MSLDWRDVTFIAATPVESKALRRALPHARIVETGIALASLRDDLGAIVISYGLAGGLRTGLKTGALLIPRTVRTPHGELLTCDSEVVDALAAGARALGIEPLFDPLLTSDHIVAGAERAQWAAQGFAAVDMETGCIQAPRVAALRVVLDTPEREISTDWQRPLLALLKPSNWPQALWLAREAPRAANLAAKVAMATQGIGA